MAKKVSVSGLAGKLGQAGQKAVQTHREDETVFDTGGSLPADIENGVAELVDCHFGQYKKGDNEGEYFFYAAGVVVAPEVHNGIPIKGLRTSIMEPMCDTPDKKSRPGVDDHIEWVLNELRKLGADTKELELDDLEAVAAALKEEAPTFRFRTWKGKPSKQYPNPRVNEVWGGLVDFTAEAAASGVEDNTEEGEVEEAEETTEDEVNFAALGKAADGKNKTAAKAAQEQLSALCEESGIDPEQLGTWTEVATALSEATEAGGGGEDEPADEGKGDEAPTDDTQAVPAKEEVWFYKPPKSKKRIEVEITAVFESKQTVNCKNLEDNRTVYKVVPWSELSDS